MISLSCNVFLYIYHICIIFTYANDVNIFYSDKRNIPTLSSSKLSSIFNKSQYFDIINGTCHLQNCTEAAFTDIPRLYKAIAISVLYICCNGTLTNASTAIKIYNLQSHASNHSYIYTTIIHHYIAVYLQRQKSPRHTAKSSKDTIPL